MACVVSFELMFAPARLGHISFINSLPVVLPIEKEYVVLNAASRLANPAELNRQYLENELDLGAMSTFFFLEQRDLTLIPKLSISGQERVGSVLLFSKIPISNLDNKTISCTSSSATSVNLLRVLLQESHAIKANLVIDQNPNLNNPETSAALVIGDQALALEDSWSKDFLKVDLAEWWMQRYNLPMVFGVWAAKTKWLEANRPQFDGIVSGLLSALKLGLGDSFAEVIDAAHERSNLDKNRLQKYFQNELDFSFTEKHMQSLLLYEKLCRQHQLL